MEIFDTRNQQYKGVSFDYESILYLRYDLSENRTFAINLVEEEDAVSSKITRRNGLFAMELTPRKDELRIAFSLLKSCTHKVKNSLKIVSELIRLNGTLEENNIIKKHEIEKEFVENTLKFVLKQCLDGHRIYFYHDGLDNPPFFLEQGAQTMANQIRNYRKKHKTLLDRDTLHEIDTLIYKLENIEYRGFILVYAGSTKIRKIGESDFSAEFDGIICMPNLNNENLMYFIEAKKQRKRKSAATNQLENRLRSALSSDLDFKAEILKEFDAHASIYFKRDV